MPIQGGHMTYSFPGASLRGCAASLCLGLICCCPFGVKEHSILIPMWHIFQTPRYPTQFAPSRR